MKQTSSRKSMKGYYLTTFLIGLGFFTMGLMDPLYDTYIPIFLGKYIESNALIGTIMTLDNMFAIFLIPIFSAISDRTRTRIGRRMPFIITLLPLSAFAFGLIPFAALSSLVLLIVLIFALNIFKQSVRGPVVALMPDIIPGDIRSEANGVINTMGGIASIVGTIGLARLMDVKINLPSGPTDNILAFPIASVLVIIAVILLFFFVKEQKEGDFEKAAKERIPILTSLKQIFAEKDKSAFFVLISLLFWFIGYQGVLPFVGKYSVEILQTSKANAALAAGMVGIAYALFAIPSGIIAHNKGRKKTIRFALVALAIVLMLVFVHSIV
ncbi:MAG: MFS transporter, partial [Spirochaetia bacterium]|nr:MFS transporter [Spirochaetia bacterium]